MLHLLIVWHVFALSDPFLKKFVNTLFKLAEFTSALYWTFCSGLFFCPAGSHSLKQTEFITEKKTGENLQSLEPPLFQLNLTPCSSVSSRALSVQALPFQAQPAAASLCSACVAKPVWLKHAVVNPPIFFLTSILSSLHLALQKNNITKFPNVCSRVRNFSSSTSVVVDVSQTWQASLCYLWFTAFSLGLPVSDQPPFLLVHFKP